MSDDSRWLVDWGEQLRLFGADQAFDRLCAAGANREQLLRRLWALQHLPNAPRRLSKREARARAKTIRATAKLIEELVSGSERLPPLLGGSRLLGGDILLTLNLPKLLQTFAEQVDQLPVLVAEKWEPLKTAAMCQLVWYVKHTTGAYHDEELSALMGTIMNQELFTEGLKQWRSRHKKEIRSLGPLEVLPYLSRPPR